MISFFDTYVATSAKKLTTHLKLSCQAARSILLASIAPAMVAAPIMAQDITPGPDGMCDGSMTGSTYDFDAIAEIITGDWGQLGRAQRYTLGTTNNTFQVNYDSLRNQLLIEGGGGPRLELKPFNQAKLADVPLTNNNLRETTVSYISADGSRTVNMTGQDMETLTGCPIDTAPSFYWTYGQGDRRSYGILVFLSGNHGFGVIGNSTSASRSTLFYR